MKPNQPTINKPSAPQQSSAVPTISRREELLQTARKYRNKFVLSAALAGGDVHSRLEAVVASMNPKSSGANGAKKTKDKGGVASKARIPAFDAIDSVLTYLTDLADDGLVVDSESILADNVDFYEQFNLETDGSGSNSSKDPFAIFLDKLRKPAAVEVVKAIQAFVLKFENNKRSNGVNFSNINNNSTGGGSIMSPIYNTSSSNPDSTHNQWASDIWKFIEKTGSLMRDNVLWVQESPAQFVKSCEHLEKFIFIKLRPFIFCDATADERQANNNSRARIRSLHFLSPEHLDIKINNLTKPLVKAFIESSPYLSSGIFLPDVASSSSMSSSVHMFKEILQEPIALIRCLDNCETIVDMIYLLKLAALSIARIVFILKNGSIEQASPSSSASAQSPSGADDFLPLMILTVQAADLEKTQTILSYLQTYASPKKLVSETGYLLTQFISAVHFLENADSNALTISPEEFDQAMEASRSINFFPQIMNASDLSTEKSGRRDSNSSSSSMSDHSDVDDLSKKLDEIKQHIKIFDKRLKLSTNSISPINSSSDGARITDSLINSNSTLEELLSIYKKSLPSENNDMTVNVNRTDIPTSDSRQGKGGLESSRYMEALRAADQRYYKLQQLDMLTKGKVDGGSNTSDVTSIRQSIQAVSSIQLSDISRDDLALLVQDYQKLSRACAVFIHDKLI